MKPVIIGAGLAGMTVALALAPRPVILLAPRRLGEECASAWAQGGIAASVSLNDDNPALHAADTLAAGAGLCDPAVVQAVTDDGAMVIETLVKRGVVFDRDAAGQLRLGLEAAHSKRRIVHAADSTGAAVVKALIEAVRATPSIEVMDNAVAIDLLCDNNAMQAVVIERQGLSSSLPACQVVLATGGAGAQWLQTSNPSDSWGRGLALAARAGAVLADLEFMQFHPTCIAIGRDPMPLASEALRGEGCTLIDDKGERFVDELLPRDVVARAIWKQQSGGGRVFLDARTALGTRFAQRFPGIYAVCQSAGLDPATTPIPVSTGAHYHMGGVLTDLRGRTHIEGLWACGEVACTGLHGANRLASNSLLEAASFGARVAEDIAGRTNTTAHYTGHGHEAPEMNRGDVAAYRGLMSEHVGVMRDEAGLQKAIAGLAPHALTSGRALVGLMIAESALRRTESRGAHTRSDEPETKPAWGYHQTMTMADVMPLIETYKNVEGV